MKKLIVILLLLNAVFLSAQTAQDSTQVYKKRVLESAEVDFLMSYYQQDGDHAAVTGGIGTEKLNNITPTIVLSVPLNEDDVLTIDGEVSAYTSASSSNVNPFDGTKPADPFVASSGASGSDAWIGANASYSHSSDDRNRIWSGKLSISNEFDYFSIGIGGSHTWLFNQKNTEFGLSGNVFFDSWYPVYPYELRPFAEGGSGYFPGTPVYNPTFSTFTKTGRNSYSAGLFISQILSKRLQGSLSADYVMQQGLLSTPFQRVYFSDVDSSFYENFRLADDIERMPDTRSKVAVGGRLNYYINQYLTLRTFYRYYFDDWGIQSHTFSVEVPVKISGSFTLYPSWRFYNQTAADYFAPYAKHLSTEQFYTSDYDLSKFTANQYGFGISYTDIFTRFHISKFGMKSIDLKYHYYSRDTGLKASIIALGVHFVMD
ncbi:MAG TPA: DUF3570 domain-containing protein [Bacteroidales bacterium]|nr:DUF3570 domain-containing protein [Bacteroidales bacterium]